MRRRRAHAAHGDEQVEAVDLLRARRSRRRRARARGGRARSPRAPSARRSWPRRIRSSSMPRSRRSTSARFGTVKKARSWCALVSFWFTLRAMSSASVRTCSELHRLDDRAAFGEDDPISARTGQFLGRTIIRDAPTPAPAGSATNRPSPTGRARLPCRRPIDSRVRPGAPTTRPPTGQARTRSPRRLRDPSAERGSPDENPGAAPRPRGLESPGQVPGRLPGRHRRRPVLPARGPGALRGGVPGRAGAEPVRLGLRPGLRRAVRGRLPPRLHRRADHHPRAEADGDGALRRRVDPPGHAGPPARGAGAGGEPLRRPPPHRAAPDRRRARPAQGRRGRRGPGGALGGARPRAPRLRGDRLRGGRRSPAG